MSEPLTPEQRVALIKEIESQEAASRRRALWITWLSVAAAGVVLAAVVFGAWQQLARSRTALEAAETRHSKIEASTKDLEARAAKAQEDLKTAVAKQQQAEDAAERASQLARRASEEYNRSVGRLEQAGATLISKVSVNAETTAAARDFKKSTADARSNAASVQRDVAALSKDQSGAPSTYVIEIGRIEAFGISRDLEWDFVFRRMDTKRVLLSFTAGGKRKPRGPDEFIDRSRTLLNSRSKPIVLDVDEGLAVDLLLEAKSGDPRQRVQKNATYRLVGVPPAGSLRAEMPVVVARFGRSGNSEGVLIADLLIRRGS
jgi:Skp family chaperone for outer membrane proteins